MEGTSSGLRRLTVRSGLVPEDAGRFFIAVEDTGMGIPPENLTKIFSHGFTTKTDGPGFGLHASANSAKAMRGALTAASDGPGRGARFRLELPVRPASDTAADLPPNIEALPRAA
jgi:C4-dicarboxylate-specific signal transduction histidine kinase